MKGNQGNAILVGQPGSGSRTLAKMAGWLLNITINDLSKKSVSSLLEDVIKVLKTGGKVD